MTEQELLDLKDEIDEAKQIAAELKGQKKALMSQLNEDWECTTIKQAKKKLTKQEQEVAELEKEIEKGIAEIEETYFEE